jgi:hypothetical protein
MQVTCPNCGRETERRRDRFCDGCGAFLGWDAGEPAESQLLPEQAPERAPQRDDQRAGVQIRLERDLVEVAPGNAAATAFTVKNLGTQVEEFRFLVDGPEWLVVQPATMSVYPGQEGTGAIQAAPPRRPSSEAGVTPFRLTATSALHAHVSSSAAGRIDVAPYYELAAELIPASGRGRGWTRHHIALDNRGNVPLRVSLNPTGVADGLRLSVPAVAEVPPGVVSEVPVAVHGPFRLFGRPEPKTFSVIVEVPKPLAPSRLPGTRVVVPLLPSWVPVAVTALLAAGVAAAAFALAHHHPKPGNSQTVAVKSSATTAVVSASAVVSTPVTAKPTVKTTAPPTQRSRATPPPPEALAWTKPASAAAGDIISLTSVSCPTTIFCIAGDDAGRASTYNGTGWVVPSVGGYPLTSVSCPAITFCAAVNSAGGAFTFNGAKWSSSTLTSHDMTAVSCLAANFCAAVNSTGSAFTYNGATWSPPSTMTSGDLISVSCPTVTFCIAVNSDGSAFTYNGAGWSPGDSIDSSGGNLTSISCPTITFCAAVNSTGDALTYNDGAWSAPKSIGPAGGNLTSISCPKATFCAAVNSTGDAFTYNGATWSAPKSIDSTGGNLTSISCATTTFCAAVDSTAHVFEGT